MRKVFKYQLEITEETQKISVPGGGKAIVVREQDGLPTLWIEVFDNHEPIERYFRIYGTGWEINPSWTYVGSAFIGPFVWHVYTL